MKKTLPIISLLITLTLCIGCNQGNYSKDKTNQDLKNDSSTIGIRKEVKGDFSSYEYDISMYNRKFLVTITPAIDSAYNQYEANILLTRKRDTIFNKIINLDSLVQIITKHRIFEDKPEYSKIATDYTLRKIKLHGVRTYTLKRI